MSKNMKIVVVVFAGLLVGCSGIAGVAYYWLSTSGKLYLSQMKDSAKKTVVEGTDFGKTTDQNGCVKEALSRLKADHTFNGQLTANFFLEGCLRSTAPASGFCDDVPAQGEIMKTATWSAQRCKNLDASNEGCAQLMRTAQRVCLHDANPDAKK